MSKVIQAQDDTVVSLWQAPTVAAGGASAEEQASLQPPTAEHLEQIQSDAYEEGYQAGREAGLQAGEQEIHARIDQLDQLLHSLARPLETADEQVEQELVTLAVTVARQLVRRELQTSPDEIVAVVREALGVLPSHSNDIRVVMHPDDAQLVREVLSDTAQERAWRIVEDPALTRGGCRIDTDVSRVDATLEHRLNQVIASVWGDARTGGGG